MSDTPRTDAEVAKINYDSGVMDGYEFARQLERELSRLRPEAARVTAWIATSPHGDVLHLSEEDGWKVEPVQSCSPQEQEGK